MMTHHLPPSFKIQFTVAKRVSENSRVRNLIHLKILSGGLLNCKIKHFVLLFALQAVDHPRIQIFERKKKFETGQNFQQ